MSGWSLAGFHGAISIYVCFCTSEFVQNLVPHSSMIVSLSWVEPRFLWVQRLPHRGHGQNLQFDPQRVGGTTQGTGKPFRCLVVPSNSECYPTCWINILVFVFRRSPKHHSLFANSVASLHSWSNIIWTCAHRFPPWTWDCFAGEVATRVKIQGNIES